MDPLDRSDLLFRSMLGRFMSLPSRQRIGDTVTAAQMRALFVLEDRGSATLRELAHVLGVTSPTTSELVDRMVRAGFVRREDETEDRRRLVLTLRPRGRRLLEALAKRRREKLGRLMRRLTPGESHRLVAALETIDGLFAKGGDR